MSVCARAKSGVKKSTDENSAVFFIVKKVTNNLSTV